MNQQRELKVVAELSGARERFQSLRPEGASCCHDFDANDDIAIRFYGSLDLVFVDQPRIGEDAVARARHRTQRREVDVIKYARFGLVGNVAAKYRQQTVTRASGIHNGGYAGADTENVGVGAEGSEAVH
jgi:hypothetical protein